MLLGKKQRIKRIRSRLEARFRQWTSMHLYHPDRRLEEIRLMRVFPDGREVCFKFFEHDTDLLLPNEHALMERWEERMAHARKTIAETLRGEPHATAQTVEAF